MNVVNNADTSSLRAPWQNGPYKTHTHTEKHAEHQDEIDIQNKLFLQFDIWLILFIKQINVATLLLYISFTQII